jgi:IS30 family transposase
MTYTQLSQNERYQISALLTAGHSKKTISHQHRRHRSTIDREISRCKALPGYSPQAAQQQAIKDKQEGRNTNPSPVQ